MGTEDRRLGRPTKLDETIARRLIAAFGRGMSQAGACRYAGISPDSLQRWLAAGRAELAAIEALPEGDYACSDAAALAMAVDRALGEFEFAHLGNIEVAADSGKNWTASAWLMERRFPKEWGKRVEVEHLQVLLVEVDRLAQERGLDAESTARIKDFVAERLKRQRSA